MDKKAMQSSDPADTLSGLLASLLDRAKGSGRLTVHQLREAVGERSFGPFLLIPAIIEISPIGGIPGVPTIIAVIIVVFALQVVFNRKHLWLPSSLEQYHLDNAKVTTALEYLIKPASYVDKVLKPRLFWATRPPTLQLIALSVIALVVSVPALEFIPFASTLPMLSVALLGAALLCRDGLVAVLAMLGTAAASLSIIWFFSN